MGTSLLAMDGNDDAGCLKARGVRTFFASRLAATGNTLQICRAAGLSAQEGLEFPHRTFPKVVL
ncbi:hypothetical protein ASE98_02685 [Pseudomonas sp. Leaf48]|nr:hypothetical protein ASE98_02685 [Pseudomonas sp. Leaf48]